MNKSSTILPAWTAEEIEFFLAFKGECTNSEIAKALGRSYNAVKSKSNQLYNPNRYYANKRKCFRKSNASPSRQALQVECFKKLNDKIRQVAANRGNIWTIKDSQYVSENMNENSRVLALHLGRSIFAIRAKKESLKKAGFFANAT